MIFTDLYSDLIKERQEYIRNYNKRPVSDLEVTYWYCFDVFREGTAEVYNKICSICKEHDINGVFDIGCCFAFQSRIFKSNGIHYCGLEMVDYIACMAAQQTSLICYGKYPLGVRMSKFFRNQFRIAAVSNLCVGYQADSDDVYKQLAQDFDYFCGGVSEEAKQKLRRYFNVEEIDRYIVWCEKVDKK